MIQTDKVRAPRLAGQTVNCLDGQISRNRGIRVDRSDELVGVVTPIRDLNSKRAFDVLPWAFHVQEKAIRVLKNLSAPLVFKKSDHSLHVFLTGSVPGSELLGAEKAAEEPLSRRIQTLKDRDELVFVSHREPNCERQLALGGLVRMRPGDSGGRQKMSRELVEMRDRLRRSEPNPCGNPSEDKSPRDANFGREHAFPPGKPVGQSKQ
jgi:hypothetical protein